MEEHTVNKKKIDESSLLNRFNRRDEDAFCEIHKLYFNRLYHFANKKFASTSLLAEDVIQDIFVSIWEKKSLKFNNLSHLLGYAYLSIRNRHKDFVIREERVDRFTEYQRFGENQLFSDIVESETLSIINYAVSILPSECAKVFRMHIDGWDIKEIAEVLNKSQSTVYNQRNEAIKILRKKISQKSFLQIVTFFSLT